MADGETAQFLVPANVDISRRAVSDEVTGWQDEANCLGVDPDLFYPERGESLEEARAVCRACVVQEECLEYALTHSEKFGVWGGMSERQRRRIIRQRNLAQHILKR